MIFYNQLGFLNILQRGGKNKARGKKNLGATKFKYEHVWIYLIQVTFQN